MKIVITGATGLIGNQLQIDLYKQGHQVIALSQKDFPLSHLPVCDAVIHLAGQPIADQRWSEKVKKKILDSRIEGTRQVVQAMKAHPPKVFICASAIGFYGDRGEESLTEASSRGEDFLSDVVVQWEQEAFKAQSLGIRTLCIRSGVVLARQGGALAKMPPVILGSGKNWMSWIHLQDWVDFVIQALNNSACEGSFNLVSPGPVRQKDFVKQLAKARQIPLVLWTPKFIFKLMLGQMSEMLLASQKVIPQKLINLKFAFRFPNLEEALKDIYQDESYLVQDFRTWQVIEKPLPEVFNFFSEAQNLEKLTPDFLNFHIQKVSTPQIQKGTIIDYRLKIHGVPAGWQTEIIEWDPQKKFVDFQNKGPYSLWHHTHTFTALPSGTLIEDRIKYKIPGHILGWLVGGWMIQKDINAIFRYRREAILRWLSKS